MGSGRCSSLGSVHRDFRSPPPPAGPAPPTQSCHLRAAAASAPPRPLRIRPEALTECQVGGGGAKVLRLLFLPFPSLSPSPCLAPSAAAPCVEVPYHRPASFGRCALFPRSVVPKATQSDLRHLNSGSRVSNALFSYWAGHCRSEDIKEALLFYSTFI